MTANRGGDKEQPASPAGAAAARPAETATPAGQAPRAGRRRRRWPLLLFALLVLAAAGCALYVWATLSFSYSSGERAGYVQKFSHKGWLCKTWEGELAMVNLPGAMPEIFRFTVRDDAVATRLNQTMGQRVALHYEQHRGVPSSCFGDTEYFVTDVRAVKP
ncbi:MAG TPA: hypothetical protein VHG32_10345 [Thermoanaerobaculia bacterium]|jgi:hypothetical protein|nr:hypothetical protein [Thermoanaerobaculia bacterium]